MDTPIKHNQNASKAVGGIILIAVGLVFLMRGMDFMPAWIFSWPSIVLLVGLFAGYKSGFRYGGWLVPVGLGLIFSINHALGHGYDFSKYLFAVVLIFLGLYSIFKPSNYRPYGKKNRPSREYTQPMAEHVYKTDAKTFDINYIFTSRRQQVYNKHFQGGNVTAAFGGGELDLSHAGFEKTAVLDMLTFFGGVKLIVPAHWEIQSEITSVFGGVSDNRGSSPKSDPEARILVLRGVAFCGGIEIISRTV
ncbi:LiaF domain-containing protein [Pedobacter sp. SYP-B3415]|uniref:LiaF transmembrane domain-containing protein n=1 Tax=Pedobacter sp. SYP-B3415 TaxID=2496641 RepID=UPI00101B600F|nr:LiaF domain-containing protein [Pedobacter sp. SYP-B3415]